MKLSLLAATVALLPVSALAHLGTAPTDPAPSASKDSAALTQAKNDLYNEIEGWRASQLPHTNPPAKVTTEFEPRLDEIKADVRVAAKESELDKPRKDLIRWEHEVVLEEFTSARRGGLKQGTLDSFSQAHRQQAQLAAAVHGFFAQSVAQGSFAGTSQRVTSGLRNSSGLFDGMALGSPLSGGPAVSEGAPYDPKDPARYAKVRQILISQGASARVVDLAIKEAIRQNADPLLVLAVINQESGFNTRAKSSCGARGLMQLMPDTAGVRNANVLYDAQTNLRKGIAYLKSMWGQFVGGSMTAIASINPWTSHQVKAAVAAYNAGPGAVRKYSGVPPYRETQGYVQKVLGYYERFKQYLTA